MPDRVNSTWLNRFDVVSGFTNVTTDFVAVKLTPLGSAGDTVKFNIGVDPGELKLVPPVGIIAAPPVALTISAENDVLRVALLLLINVTVVMLGLATEGLIPVGCGQTNLPALSPVPVAHLKTAPF